MSIEKLGSKIDAMIALKRVNNNGRDKILAPCQSADGQHCQNYDSKILCKETEGLLHSNKGIQCPLQKGVLAVVSTDEK